MSRISRLIIYDGLDEDLALQLSRSMSEGIHVRGPVEITIIKLSSEDAIINGFTNRISKKIKNLIPTESTDHHFV